MFINYILFYNMIHKYVVISSPQHPHEVDAIIAHCTDEEIEPTQPFNVRAGTTLF